MLGKGIDVDHNDCQAGKRVHPYAVGNSLVFNIDRQFGILEKKSLMLQVIKKIPKKIYCVIERSIGRKTV
jgi:hypothetical protein